MSLLPLYREPVGSDHPADGGKMVKKSMSSEVLESLK